MNANCNWQGKVDAADVTCTMTSSGWVVDATEAGASVTVISRTEVSQEYLQTLDSNTATASSGSSMPSMQSKTSVTPPSSKLATSVKATGAPSQTTGVVVQSKAFAPAGPLPTGAMAFAGGAVGLLAAALAL